jgi:branched-chain amino acid transport system ATP-binding protein
MLLEIKDLWVHYGKAEALRGISMDIPEGAIVTLIGANGAGKSTTLRTISGLVRPSSGEILYAGKSITGLSPHEIVRLGIGHVPEGRRLFHTLTVEQNLEMGGFLVKKRSQFRETLEEMYAHFPIIKERRKHLGSELSGGEQQVVAVARALMHNPKLLLMDEPTMGLAPIMVEEIGQIVTEVHERGVTVLLVEQNARLALRLADKAYVLEVGKIAMHGDAKTIANDEYITKCYLGT